MAKLNDLDKLHIFDTIHDFKIDRAKNKSNEKQEKIKFYLVNFIKTFLKAGNNITKFNDVISYLTNGKVQSLGDYERNIEHYYEMISSEYKTKLFATTKESITYGDIIRSANDRKSPNSPWVKYKSLYGIQNGLTIGVGNDQEYTSFGMIQKNKKENVIAEFILNYMFPGKESNKNTFYFTADTNLGTVKKIFFDIKEAHGLITPANIADSAGTQLKPLQNRNDYIFPVNKQNIFEFNSNFYTKNAGCKLSFANNKFSDKNPYGFRLNIQHQKNNFTFNFSETEHNGPSVPYLGDLIINDSKPKDPGNCILNINRLLEDKPLIEKGILLDLKRTGDYEQVNSAITISNDTKTPFVILTTIDILCSLYARINQQNNILIGEGKEEMTLYRFAKGKALDPDVLELQRKKYQLMETAENIIILRDLQDNRLFKDIEQSVQYWNRFFKDGLFKSNNPKQTESKKVENIVTAIIKIRVSDILKRLNVLHAEMEKIQIPDKKTMESYLTEIDKILKSIETSKDKQEILAIKKNIQKIEKEVIERFENIGVNTILNRTFELNGQTMKYIHEGKNPLDLNYMVYDDNNHQTHPLFKHTGNSTTLNFSNAIYNHIFNKLYNFERILSSSSSRNRDKKLYDRLSCDANDNYFNYVKSIYDSFFDKGLGEEVYNILNPPKTDNASVIEWYSNIEIQLERCLARNDPSTIYMVNYFNEENTRGGGTKRKRDASSLSKSKKHNYYHTKRKETLDTIQCRELSDLLRSIAGMAAAYIESIITNQFGESVPSMDRLVAYLQQEEIFVYVLEVMQEIEIVWIDGILNIQRNINDAYEYVPSESEYLVLNMLSYYYKDRISNDFDDGNMQLNKDFYYRFEKDDEIKPSRRRTTIQATTKVNDIGGLILTNPKNIPAEIINLLALTLIDNTMQGDRQQREETTKKGYFYHLLHHSDIPMNFFDNQSSWNDLPRYLYVFISYIVKGNVETLREFRKISGGGTSGGYTKKRKSKNHKRNNNRKTKKNC